MQRQLSTLLALLPVAAFAWYYWWANSLQSAGLLPAPLATHWGPSGEADGFSSLNEHLWAAGAAFLIPGAIWAVVILYPRIPSTIRIVLMLVTGVLFATMAGIQIAAIDSQIGLLDARDSALEFPLLVVLAPVAVLLILFMAKPRIDVGESLTVYLRGIPMFRAEYSDIESARKSVASWRSFGGLGLRVSGKKVAFLPNSGEVIEIVTRKGETVLVRTDSADEELREIGKRMA
ncbi:MAG: DUF1648 domain-containing protein [Aquiluna sp.]